MRCSRVDEVVLAVTTNPHDEPLLTLARRLGVRWYRGSEHDVLSRYRGAAREADADLVVRVTADCPLIDPEETDTVDRSARGASVDLRLRVEQSRAHIAAGARD